MLLKFTRCFATPGISQNAAGGETHLRLLLGEGDVGPVLGIKINADEATDCIHQAEKMLLDRCTNVSIVL